MKNINLDKKKRGFTMIELLVVFAILGILAGLTTLNIKINLIKSRDAARKSDLINIQRALEMYANDNGSYPVGASGYITVGGAAVGWGDVFDSADGKTVYMNQLPEDPKANPDYCYQNGGSSSSYQLYARLENTKDSSCLDSGCSNSRSCGGSTYNYGVSSSNLLP